jgi:indolepyruvate ferredoxin oxidoreductase, alpha subunit
MGVSLLKEKLILTGNQAVSRGFWEGGGVIAASYPGSPTVEILDSLKSYKEVHSQWGANEKVALEIAMGGSFAGARSMVSMKHVGINIASDPFMTFTQIKTKGGFLLVVGDDPGLTSSQNEQDSRFFGKFANAAVLEPSNPQEVRNYVIDGLRISEEFNTPVIIRLTTRLCHARGIVEVAERIEAKIEGFVPDQSRYCMLPPYANKQQYFMHDRMETLRAFNNEWRENLYEEVENSEVLIITSGLTYQYLKELTLKISIFKLAMVYPLPADKIRELSSKYKRVIVLEELTPFIEKNLKAQGIEVYGKEFFPYTGEITTEVLREGLFKAGLIENVPSFKERDSSVPSRTPMLCSGCPHRPVFHILKKARATVVGDIGCYSLGILEPFEVHKTNISMGASLGNALGMAIAHKMSGINKPIVATIGDGTFFHSGLSGFVDLAKTKENITVIVMDNRTTAMTGGQVSPTTGDHFKDQFEFSLSIPEILRAFGIQDITVVDQFQYKDTKDAILSAMKREHLSVIVTTRPCALNFKIKEPHYYVDESICISCRSCIGVNCPPISMEQYEGKPKKNSYINPDMCVGCSVCSQVCPVGAIKKSDSK